MTSVDEALSHLSDQITDIAGIPDEALETVPSLILLNTEYLITVGYYMGEPARPNQKKRMIQFPFMQASINVKSHKITISPISPQDFGLTGRGYVGTTQDIPSETPADIDPRRKYIEILGFIENNNLMSSNNNMDRLKKVTALSVLNLRNQITEIGFEAYYEIYSRQFIIWIRSNT